MWRRFFVLPQPLKPDVIADIRGHFRDKVGVDLRPLMAGEPLQSRVRCHSHHRVAKYEDIYRLLETGLPEEQAGGPSSHCATRKQTEEVSAFLRERTGGR